MQISHIFINKETILNYVATLWNALYFIRLNYGFTFLFSDDGIFFVQGRN